MVDLFEITIPPFQISRLVCVPLDGHPGDGDLPPVQSMEFGGAVFFRFIFPPLVTTLFARVFRTILSSFPNQLVLA